MNYSWHDLFPEEIHNKFQSIHIFSRNMVLSQVEDPVDNWVSAIEHIIDNQMFSPNKPDVEN